MQLLTTSVTGFTGVMGFPPRLPVQQSGFEGVISTLLNSLISVDVYTAQLREEVTAESAGLDRGDEDLPL